MKTLKTESTIKLISALVVNSSMCSFNTLMDVNLIKVLPIKERLVELVRKYENLALTQDGLVMDEFNNFILEVYLLIDSLPEKPNNPLKYQSLENYTSKLLNIRQFLMFKYYKPTVIPHGELGLLNDFLINFANGKSIAENKLPEGFTISKPVVDTKVENDKEIERLTKELKESLVTIDSLTSSLKDLTNQFDSTTNLVALLNQEKLELQSNLNVSKELVSKLETEKVTLETEVARLESIPTEQISILPNISSIPSATIAESINSSHKNLELLKSYDGVFKVTSSGRGFSRSLNNDKVVCIVMSEEMYKKISS